MPPTVTMDLPRQRTKRPESAAEPTRFDRSAPPETSDVLDAARGRVAEAVAPVWPLRDYVAVNPFLGWTHLDLLSARSTIRSFRDAELLPGSSELRVAYEAGEFTLDDVESALEECCRADPATFLGETPRGLEESLHADQSGSNAAAPNADESGRLRTVSEQVDAKHGTGWSRIIVDEIGRHCAAHYDEGHAQWPSPWRDASLYAAWRASCVHDLRFGLMGLPHFNEFVQELPDDPRQAIVALLDVLDVPSEARSDYLLCLAFSIPGWAASVRYRVRQSEFRDEPNDDLVGLLAMRLAHDVAVAQSPRLETPLSFERPKLEGPSRSVRQRMVLQVAREIAFRRQLVGRISRNPGATTASTARKSAQMVFCIDVRSEVIRRHLEATGDDLQTMGFAGFFGMPIAHVPLEGGDAVPQCPALIDPPMTTRETLRDGDPADVRSVTSTRLGGRLRSKVWKSFQTAATSCFSFVESLGLVYAAELVGRTLLRTPSKSDPVGDRLGPELVTSGDEEAAHEQRVSLAAGVLTNLGLAKGHARLVVLCGHEAEVTNNPYRAGLDCGACCGHSGEPNARLAASLLNREDVRTSLRERGFDIPTDTWFVAGVHVTTTDEIRFHDVDSVPATHREELTGLAERCGVAAKLARTERAARMGHVPEDRLPTRGRDWSETRPEWGLAGNAAFVVAPRERTRGLDLGGRAFLHDYDHTADPEGAVLETLLTAPLVVTSWINLQYYASAVDNRAFGSGTKVLHNVVGRFGVLQGNGGDLMTGLPWQSLHDGTRFQHPPLRLLAIVGAPREAIGRVLEAHPPVRDLARNGWVHLVSMEDDSFHRYTANDEWEALSSNPLPKPNAAADPVPVAADA